MNVYAGSLDILVASPELVLVLSPLFPFITLGNFFEDHVLRHSVRLVLEVEWLVEVLDNVPLVVLELSRSLFGISLVDDLELLWVVDFVEAELLIDIESSC